MRLLVDSLIALMLAGILAGILLYHGQQTQLLGQCQVVHRALARLQEQTWYHAGLADGPATTEGFPLAISPMWFDQDLPVNVLVPGRQPWLDIAPAGDLADHPPDPVVLRAGQAGFWYNPNRGLFRARVAPQFTDHDTLELYNQLNGAALRALPQAADASRAPHLAEPIPAAPLPAASPAPPGPRPAVRPKLVGTP